MACNAGIPDLFRLPEYNSLARREASLESWGRVLVGIRYMPREVQEIDYQKRLIPYIPAGWATDDD